MNRRTAQLLERVAATRPAAPHATHQVAGEATRRAMFERIMAAPGGPIRSPRRRPTRPVSRALPFAVAGVTFVVVAALSIGLMPGRGPGGAPPASALELAARTAAAQPHPVPGPGLSWYQRTSFVTDPGTREQLRTVKEDWTAPDGRAWMRLDTKGQGHHQRTGIERNDPDPNDPSAPLSVRQQLAFPTALPAAVGLLTRLAAEAETDLPELAFQYLTSPVMNPAQRATLFRVLAGSAGVTVSQGERDGAKVTRVSVVGGGDGPKARAELTFDPATTTVLSLRTVALERDGNHRPGQVLAEVRFAPARIVPAPGG